MAKYMTEHSSMSAFDSKKAELAAPHVAKIAEGGVIVVGFKNADGSIHLYSGGHEYVPAVGGTKAGDIAYVTAGGEKKTCTRQEWNASLGTPIGVVVVPSTHTADGKSRIMSLCNMSLQTPEVGSLANEAVSGDNYMMWGKYDVDLEGLTNYETAPLVAAVDDGEGGTMVESGTVCIPSDIWNDTDIRAALEAMGEGAFTADQCFVQSADGGALAFSDMFYEMMFESAPITAPSPYAADGVSKNPDFAVAGTVFADQEGKANTQVILNAIADQYLNGDSVQNKQDAYPAANCCLRFHTVGTAKGDWYLPSLPEFTYLLARLGAINASLAALGDSAVECGNLLTYEDLGSWLWSSSEFSSSHAWLCASSYASCGNDGKDDSDDSGRVRAFIAL